MSQEVAQKIRSRSTKTIELEDGLEVKIRKVSKYELLSLGVLGPALQSMPDDPKDKKKAEAAFTVGADKWSKVVEATVTVGMADPKVWQGLEVKCPPDQVMLYALSDWMENIFQQILDLSGFDAEVTNAASFRDSKEGGAKADKDVSSDRKESSPTSA